MDPVTDQGGGISVCRAPAGAVEAKHDGVAVFAARRSAFLVHHRAVWAAILDHCAPRGVRGAIDRLNRRDRAVGFEAERARRFPPWWSRHCTDGRPHKRESSSRQGRAGPTPISCSPPESGHLPTPHTCAGTSVPSPCVLACPVCGRCASCGTRRCRSSRLPEYLSNRSRIRQVTGTLG